MSCFSASEQAFFWLAYSLHCSACNFALDDRGVQLDADLCANNLIMGD